MSNQSESRLPASEALAIPAELTATQQFADRFQERLGGAYGDPALEDVKLLVNKDLPEALASGNLAEAQSTLEGGIWNDSRRTRKLAIERRDALVELHVADQGEPTPRQLNVARQEAQKAILGAEEHGDKAERSRVFNNLFTRHESSAELEEGIEWIEDLIGEESVINPKGDKIENLRVARDRLHQDYKREKEWEDNKERFSEELTAIVGEHSPALTSDRIEELSSWLSGGSAENMEFVISEINDANPQDRAILLMDLARGKIKVHDAEEFQEWREKRAHKHAADAEQVRQGAVDSARSAVSSSYES